MAINAGKKKKSSDGDETVKHISNDSAKNVCFVLMPFGGWSDDYYSSIYKPAILESGLQPYRADDLFRPSAIIKDIWSFIKISKVLLADLTGKNPNVFYELGLAHALAKPVILIANSMDEVPFDLRALRVLLFDKNAHNWGDLLGIKIKSSLNEIAASPNNSILPAFLDVRALEPRLTISPEQKGLLEIKQDIELLRSELVNKDGSSNRKLSPDQGRAMILDDLRKGLSDDEIAARLLKLGAPLQWLAREISRARGVAIGETYKSQTL